MANKGQCRPKSIPVKLISAKVEISVCRQAQRYAELRKANISLIVEEALIEYLKARAPYFSNTST